MKIIAHRGNDNINKENSIESILNSLNKCYVDGVEFDIRKTKDNKFIINHDPFYKNYFIKYTKSRKLKKIGLNTLDEVLNKICNDKIILIEVKEDGNIKTTAKYLYSILKKYKLNIYLCSFNYKFITHFKNKYNNIKCGLIIGGGINIKHINNNLDFNLISYRYKGKIPNKETFIWTVNNIKDIKKEYNIITDKSKKIYDYLKSIN